MSSSSIALCILIVDDSPEDRESYRRFLSKSRRYDFSFLEADTVDGGLEVLRTERPDGVLLDFSLPDGDGIEFLETREMGDSVCEPFIIFLTGHGSEELAVEALTKGATDYLPKRRVDVESLLHAVHTAHEKTELLKRLRHEEAEKDRVIKELREALEEVERLSGLLPICAHCKNVRKDDGYWEAVETYFADHAGARFSHGICPDCMREHYGIQ